MNELKKFNFRGSDISFQLGNGEIMVNATEMVKPFGQKPDDFLRTQRTKDFISELSTSHKCDPTELLKVINGGNNRGTWMHEDLALEMARWLSPSFAIWCNDRIKELMRHGATAINPDDLLNPDFIIRLATELKQERATNKVIEAEKELYRCISENQSKELIKSAPKVAYHDDFLSSQGLLAVNNIAMALGMSAIALNKWLCVKGIQYKCNKTYVLYADFRHFDLARPIPHSYRHSDGTLVSQDLLYWTETGKKFIIQYHKTGVIPKEFRPSAIPKLMAV